MKIQNITKSLKDNLEIITYSLILAGIMAWQASLYIQTIRVHQDLIIAAYCLQILNVILAFAVTKKMRLLAQLLLLTAILFGAVVIYYVKVLIANVI